MSAIKINIGGVVTEVSAEDVTKAIEAGELNINNENIVAYEKEQFEAYKSNISKEEYQKGKIAGEEMLIKNAGKKLGIEITEKNKNLDSLLTSYSDKLTTELKIEPNAKIAELQADNEKLRNNYQAIESEFTGFKTSIENKQKEAEINAGLLNAITVKTKVDKDIALIALASKGVTGGKDENGNLVVFKNGQIVKDDKTLNPRPVADVLTEELKLNNLIDEVKQVVGGNGGGDATGSNVAGSYAGFVDEMTKSGVSSKSLQFQEEMSKRIKAGTLKV
jgi:hypothetical protein